MKSKRKMFWQRIIYSNVHTVKVASELFLIAIPVSLILARILFAVNIFDFEIILPAISLEVFSAAFFALSRLALPRIKKLASPNLLWIYRVFWLAVLNAGMLMISGVEDTKLTMLLFGGMIALVSVAPSLNGMEFGISILNEVLWGYYISSFALESRLVEILIYASIIIAGACISRVVYTNRMQVYTLKNKIRRIEKDAMVDPLTGLLNRRGFHQQIDSIWPFCVRNDYKVALMIIDIDNFKLYNDQFGHPEGDECLKKVAKCIRSTARRTTDIVSRIGGEEFVVFIQGNREDEMIEFANTIRKNVEKLGMAHSHKSPMPLVTVSVGLEIAYPKEMDINLMYEGADQQLYLAKQSGRNAVSYSGKVKRRFSVLA